MSEDEVRRDERRKIRNACVEKLDLGRAVIAGQIDPVLAESLWRTLIEDILWEPEFLVPRYATTSNG